MSVSCCARARFVVVRDAPAADPVPAVALVGERPPGASADGQGLAAGRALGRPAERRPGEQLPDAGGGAAERHQAGRQALLDAVVGHLPLTQTSVSMARVMATYSMFRSS